MIHISFDRDIEPGVISIDTEDPDDAYISLHPVYWHHIMGYYETSHDADGWTVVDTKPATFETYLRLLM